MKLQLGHSWHTCPNNWQSMVLYLKTQYSEEEWKSMNAYEVIDEYMYKNFRGKLNRLDDDVEYVEFESVAHYNWFMLRWGNG